ncbi:uncharacterized protein LOC129927588 isoform X1 [Biomphalaria glabrata]|uniref:Uncharacterized protein LOC129927588 isoform X1 n=1 Tax=Biomphalaria glabrata TaxID=6526 RepID=A0A9W3B0W1_BIOGL|nr:uncharacterized protein LOC129927588 isoform X1 [Biomphalaria glabrata]
MCACFSLHGTVTVVALIVLSMCIFCKADIENYDNTERVETIEDYICTQRFKGCKVNYKERSCIEEEFVGCENPFPYKTKRECLRDFRGHGNICEYRKPCRNNGTCSPITTANHVRTFKCECAATGYYGDRCEHKCPKDLSAKEPKMLACLQI